MTTATQRHNGRAKRHNGHDLQARLDSLRGDFGALQRDVKGLARAAGDAAESQFDHAVKGTMKSARQAADKVEDWGTQNVKSVRQQVKKQPILACMFAAGAGALLGLCMSFRHGRHGDE